MVNCRGKTFDVYEQDEAVSFGIRCIKNWREAKAGDWIRTDDEKVLQVFGRREEHSSGRKKPVVVLRTGYGNYYTYKHKIYAQPQKRWHDKHYNGKSLVRDIRPTGLQKAFADFLIARGEVNEFGMWTADSIIASYQAIYSDNNPTQSLRRGLHILKKEHIKEHIHMNLRDKLVDGGLTDEWVIDRYKELTDTDTPAATRLNAVNRISELLGHNAKEREELHTEEIFALSDGQMKKFAVLRQRLIEENYLSENDSGKKNNETDEVLH